MFPDKGIDLLIADDIVAGLDFLAAVFLEGWLVEYLACQAHAGTEFLPVVLMGHVVEVNPRLCIRIGRVQAHRAA